MGPSRGLRGYTLIEVLVAMTLTGIVVAGTLKALTVQKKFYARQARILDARHAMRASVTILASELRDLSSQDGDLYAIGPDSLALRSTVAFGIACFIDDVSDVISLSHVSGHFRLEDADSVLVFAETGPRDDDDYWTALPVSSIAVFGPACVSGEMPDRVLYTNGSLADVWVGAPVRLFRPYAYGLFEMDGRWWLGRRNRGSATGYIPVAGPMAPPGSGGLGLQYFDVNDAVTTDRFAVQRVEIQVSAPTFRSPSEPDYRTLGSSAYLRNDG